MQKQSKEKHGIEKKLSTFRWEKSKNQMKRFVLIFLLNWLFWFEKVASLEAPNCEKGYIMTPQAIIDVIMANYSRLVNDEGKVVICKLI